MFIDWWDWIVRVAAAFGIFPGDWLNRTMHFVSRLWSAAGLLLESWFMRIAMLVTDGFASGFEIIVGFWYKINMVFALWWLRVRQLFEEWWRRLDILFTWWWYKLSWYVETRYEEARQLLDVWWERVSKILSDWWTLVSTWFSEWCALFIDLFATHKRKIIYLLTEGWPRTVWCLIDRFEIIFGAIENHLEGWAMFASNPPQALWDWIEPKLSELASNFLAEVW